MYVMYWEMTYLYYNTPLLAILPRVLSCFFTGFNKSTPGMKGPPEGCVDGVVYAIAAVFNHPEAYQIALAMCLVGVAWGGSGMSSVLGWLQVRGPTFVHSSPHSFTPFSPPTLALSSFVHPSSPFAPLFLRPSSPSPPSSPPHTHPHFPLTHFSLLSLTDQVCEHRYHQRAHGGIPDRVHAAPPVAAHVRGRTAQREVVAGRYLGDAAVAGRAVLSGAGPGEGVAGRARGGGRGGRRDAKALSKVVHRGVMCFFKNEAGTSGVWMMAVAWRADEGKRKRGRERVPW